MEKDQNNDKYFDVRRDVLATSPLCRLIYAVGKRGSGKTYSFKKECIMNEIETGHKFVYVRRWTTEIKNGLLMTVFSDVVNDPEINWSMLPYGYDKYIILPKAGNFWLVGVDENNKNNFLEIWGVITCVSDAEHFKGGVYNEYDRIIFDEFITDKGYITGDKEPDMFDKIVNTVGRDSNKTLKILMAGNPDYIIEGCPYLYNLKLSYSKMDPNKVFYYDTITPDGEVLEMNVAFIKIALSAQHLNKHTASLFGTAEERMSLSGDIKTSEYINISYEGDFEPFYCLQVETPRITNEEYHVSIYAYYGRLYGEWVCVVCKHEEYKDIAKIFCRYDQNDFRRRKIPQTYRLNIPPEERYAELKRAMSIVDANRIIVSHDNETATIYEQIKLASR